MKFLSRKKGLLLAALLAAAALLVIIRAVLLGPMVSRAVSAYIASELGLAAQIENVSGDFLTGFTINNLTLARPEPDASELVVTAGKTTVRYFLPALIKGPDAFAQTITLALRGVEVRVDTRGEGRPSEEETLLSDYFPAGLPPLTARDITLSIQDDDFALTARHGELTIEAPMAEGQRLGLVFPALDLAAASSLHRELPVRLALRYAPGAVVIEALEVGKTIMPLKGRFDLDTDANRLNYEFNWHDDAGRLSATGVLGPQQISCQLTAHHMPVPHPLLVRFFPALLPFTGMLQGELGVRFTPGKAAETLTGDLHLALTDAAFSGQPADSTINGQLAAGRLTIKEAAIRLGANALTITDAVVPLDRLAQAPLALAAVADIGAFNLQLTDIPALYNLLDHADQHPMPVENLPPHTLKLAASLHDRTITVHQGELHLAPSTVTLEDTRLTLPTPGKAWQETTLNAALRFSIADLARFSRLFRLPALTGSASGSATVSGSLRAPEGGLQLTATSFACRECPPGHLQLAVQADMETLTIRTLEFVSGTDRIELGGVFQRLSKTWQQASGRIALRNLAPYGSCLKLPAGTSGRLSVEFNKPASAKASLIARLDHGNLGAFAVDQLRVAIAESATDQYTVTAHGKTQFVAAELTGRLDLRNTSSATLLLQDMRLSGNERQLVLAKPARFAIARQNQPGLAFLEPLSLTGKTETIVLRGSFNDEGANRLTLDAIGLDSRGWLSAAASQPTFFSGGEIHAALTGTLASPHLAVHGKVAQFESPLLAAPLAGLFSLQATTGGITIERFAWRDFRGPRLNAKGVLPYDLLRQKPLPSALGLEVTIDLPDLKGASDNGAGKQPRGNLQAALNLHGTWQQPLGRLRADFSQVLLPFLPEPLGTTPLTARCDAQLADSRLTFQTLRVSAADFTLEAHGTWNGLIFPGDIPRNGVPPALPGTLDLRGTLKTADLGWLAAGQRSIRRLKGRLTGSFAVSGLAARPDLTGTMILAAGEVRLRANMPPLEALAGRLELDRQTIRLTGFTGRLGGAPFTASGKIVRQDAGFLVDAVLEGQNVLLYRDEALKIRSDAALTLRGPLSRLTLGGDLWLTDARYTKNVNFLGLFRGPARHRAGAEQLFSLTAPPWRDMAYQLRIHGRQPFLLQNNVARGVFRPHLFLRGTGELPLLTGEIYIDPSTITVPAGKITIASGLIRLLEQDPERPTVTISATSKLAGYEIAMLIQGTPDEPIVTLSSVPPLPEEELLLLVLTGKIPQTGRATRQQSTVGMNMALYLGKGLLAQWFAGDSAESDESILDRFELDIGRGITKSGDSTMEAQFRLADGVLLPADRLVLTSEKDIYDNFNAGIKIIFRFR